jgi:acetyl-CoA carboxylase carboxyltransferase component
MEKIFFDALQAHESKPELSNSSESISDLCSVMESVFLGLIIFPNTMRNTRSAMSQISDKILAGMRGPEKTEVSQQCLRIISIYLDIRKLFSSKNVSTLPYYTEFQLFVASIGKTESPISQDFRVFLARVFGYYNTQFHPGNLEEAADHSVVILFLHRAIRNIQNEKKLFGDLLHLLVRIDSPDADIVNVLNRFVRDEQEEQDDYLFKISKTLLDTYLRERGLASERRVSVKAHINAGDSAIDPKEFALQQQNKWNIDVWAQACFGKDAFKEIKIDSIDAQGVPVGSKIFRGQIEGHPCYFYCKDSRIKGGATGHREGLKYVLSTFLAYLEGVPLFVFNDGAGANIKEGVAALNRAAEGFMMNTLLTHGADREEVLSYVQQHTNPELLVLWNKAKELIGEFDIKRREVSTWRGLLVSVGIGSSTGLDVYGSSQTTLQLMIDAESSYRVLTGSRVIQSVTGESFSNYEIGGAPMMGRWTGITDVNFKSKDDLVTAIHEIMWIFNPKKVAEKGSEWPKAVDAATSKYSVLSPALIRQNVDDGRFIELKSEFMGAESVIGGLARLGGKPVLILGPRNSIDQASRESNIKSRELLEIAYKSKCPQILVFEKQWFRPKAISDVGEASEAAALFQTLKDRRGVRICVVLDAEGVLNFMMNQTADFLILVQNEAPPPSLEEVVNQNAHFVVSSMKEAFALAKRILDVVESPKIAKRSRAGSTKAQIEIPRDHNQPYDVVSNVIVPTFDAGTFLEVHQAMNDPLTGPALITGFARLRGESVAIIADQAKIMGGAPDSVGTAKFRNFVDLVSRLKLPLIMLSSSPGFLPGLKQEKLRIQAIGASSLDSNVKHKIPVVSVVLNKNFGGRLIQAFSRFLRPGIVYLAVDKSVLAVMGAQASFDLFSGAKYQELIEAGKEKEALEMKAQYIEEFNHKASAGEDGIKSGLVEWIIPSAADLPDHLAKGLKLAKKRCGRLAIASK